MCVGAMTPLMTGTGSTRQERPMPINRIVVCAIAIAGLAMLPAACAPAGPSRSTPTAGWYVQRGADATFQPCGGARLRVADGAQLRRRAADFGLHDGDPLYMQLS